MPRIAANAAQQQQEGVGAGVLLGQRSDSVVRLQAAADRLPASTSTTLATAAKQGRCRDGQGVGTVARAEMSTFGEYGVSWIARREPCLRVGAGIWRPGVSRGSLCPQTVAGGAVAGPRDRGSFREGADAARVDALTRANLNEMRA